VGPVCPICVQEQASATADQEEPPIKTGEVFHGMEILEILGRGGMGIVYKVRQPSLNRFLALKILPPDKAMAVEFASRFEREAKILAGLSHPNIISVFDFGKENNLYFFLMEYVEGKDLHEIIKEKTLTREDSIRIFLQICAALEYAHSENVVHRDIKPANVLLNPKGRVKVLDFGLAKLSNIDRKSLMLTRSDMSVGTLNYMAPEQMESSRDVDHRADIYSAGVLFYELLTGGLPLGRFEPPSSTGEADKRLDDIVYRSLEKKPEKRYQSIREMIDDLEEATATRPRPPSSSISQETARKQPSPPAAPAETGMKKSLLVAGMILSVLFGAAIVYYLVGRSGPPVETPPGKRPESGVVPGTKLSAEEKWKAEFLSIKAELDYSNHKNKRAPDTLKKAEELLVAMPVPLANEVSEWFTSQVDKLPGEAWPQSSWFSRREEARMIYLWCRDFRVLLEINREGRFTSVRDKFLAGQNEFLGISVYRGTFTLQILVWPYTTVKSLTVDGRSVIQGWKLKDRSVQTRATTLASPLVIRNIPIGKIRLTLTHPQLGNREILISPGDLENGKTCLVSGSMNKRESIQVRKAPGGRTAD
jgi:serine/threonine protein kinase